MRSILCAIDFSDSSANVLEVATGLASQYKVPLFILYTYRLIDQGIPTDMGNYKRKIEVHAKEKFLELEKKVFLAQPPVPYEFLTEIGFLSDRINFNINKNNIGMVVIGQEQANTLNEFKGQSLHNFIRHSHVPFVLVPQKLGVEAA